MNQKLLLLLNPFERIAGWQALASGIVGLIISTFISYYSNYHYHGLLHFGPAPNDALWCFAAEHLVVWIIPATIFMIGGLILSKSRVRIIDVFGTIVFAQIPLIFMNAFALLPPMQRMTQIDVNTPPLELMQNPDFILGTCISLIGLVFLIWTLIWMFKALKISCNLKGSKLVILYCIGIFGGDILCRLIISTFY